MSKSTAIIIVTFNPDQTILNNLLEKLSKSKVQIVVVDNFHPATDTQSLQNLCSIFSANLVQLEENFGIAKAQNVGIENAKKYHSDFYLFFDQDSDPSEDLVEKLIFAHQNIQKTWPLIQVGILGARYVDPRQNNPPPFLRFGGFRMIRCSCETENSIVPVDYVIASGSLVSSSALEKIGGMREDLFIDYVDIEWGLRAKSLGFQNYGVCNALMNHSLGDNPKKFGKKLIPIHSPLRHYYHFRNAILLYKEGWVPYNWKFVDGYRLILKFIYYSIFTEHPFQHFRMMALGICHGVLGRTGKLK